MFSHMKSEGDNNNSNFCLIELLGLNEPILRPPAVFLDIASTSKCEGVFWDYTIQAFAYWFPKGSQKLWPYPLHY